MTEHERIAEAARIASRNFLESVDLCAVIRQATADVQAGKVPSDGRLALLQSDPGEHPPGGILDQIARLEGIADTAPDAMQRVAALVVAQIAAGILTARIQGATREATRGDAT